MAGRGKRKWQGREAAARWLTTAAAWQHVAVATSGLTYRETLDDLREDGLDVPASADPDFSWGFYTKVKGHVNCQLRKAAGREEHSDDRARRGVQGVAGDEDTDRADPQHPEPV